MSDADLSRFVRTRFDQLRDAVDVGDVMLAGYAAEAIQAEFVAVHDGFVDTSAATLSRFVDLTSPEEGEAIGREAMQRHMTGPWFDQYLGPHEPEALRDRIRSVVATWHWHPSRFTLTEDDERVTLHAHPCGSGMRLELRGKYDGPAGWHRSVAPSPSTFMETGFPMYCNHCPEMNRAGLERGSTIWLVEGWRPHRAPEREACIQHTYKRIEDVPAEFYRRVGLEPPPPAPSRVEPAPRLFTTAELAELAVHPARRAALACAAGDRERAIELADECEAGWRGMRDSYPIWVGLLWKEVAERFGRDELRASVVATAPELIASVASGTAEQWAAFWSMHLRLQSVACTDEAVEFRVGAGAVLDPGLAIVAPDELCALLNDGIAGRGWRAGSFSADGDTLVHRLDRTA
jgi:hypothetical protein